MKRAWLAAGLLVCSSALLARGGWEDPPGGWVYVYDADPGQDAYMPGFWQIGCLDGEWMRGQSSDQWDGNAPGEGAVPHGGIGVKQLPGEGEDGGDAWVLTLEDVGDPTKAPYNLPDPSNRKLFLLRDVTGELSLAEGVTMCFRFRLDPAPPTAACVACPFFGNGFGLNSSSDNKGMIGYAERGVATLNFAIDDNQQIQFLRNTTLIDIGGSGTEWVTLWLAAELVNPATGELKLAMFMNGSDDFVAGYEDTLHIDSLKAYESASNNPTNAYISVGCPASGPDGAWQLDYFCVASGYHHAKIAVQGCPGEIGAVVDGSNVNLAWDNKGVTVQFFKIERDGVVLAAAHPGASTAYTDVGVPPGLHEYLVTPTISGRTCPPMRTTIDLCPAGLNCAVLAQTVTLTWVDRIVYEALAITRNGAEIARLPGTATSFSDTLAADFGDVTYAVVPTDGACAGATCTVTVNPPVPAETVDFGPPEGGWGYVYDPRPGDAPEDVLRYEPDHTLPGEGGCLDGTWRRHDGSDTWDGTAPGEVDTATDHNQDGLLDGPAPGGIGLTVLPSGGPGGAPAAVLSFEDVGDPSTTAFRFDGRALRWADLVDPLIPGSGSNRKLFIGHNFNDLAEDPWVPNCLLDDGATFNVRLRLTPADEVLDLPRAGVQAPDGIPPQSDGKGLLMFFWRSGFENPADPNRKLSVYLYADAAGNAFLELNSGTLNDVMRIYLGPDPQDATRFVNLWITIERPDPEEMLHRVTVYLNGVATPFARKTMLLHQGGNEGESGAGNVVIMGSKSSPGTAALQIDFVKIAAGVHAPTPFIPQGIGVHTGDSNSDGKVDIADAIHVLGYLFGGAAKPPPACAKAADANGDNKLDIADAVSILGYLFSGAAMTAPDRTPITADFNPASCQEYDLKTVPAQIGALDGCAQPCK